MPSLRLTATTGAVTRKVDRLSCVRYASARYSVPTVWIGTTVTLTAGEGRLTIVDPVGGEILAEHRLVAPGEAAVLDAHYGGPRPVPARAPRPRTAAEQAFCALGPAAQAFLTGAAAAGNTRLAADLVELAGLEAAHGREVLVAAVERAVAFRRWHAADVRAILAAGPGLPQPRPAGDLLPGVLPAVATRPLSAYALKELS